MFALAFGSGGSITGEHGVGWVKRAPSGRAARSRGERGASRDQAGTRSQGPDEPGQELSAERLAHLWSRPVAHAVAARLPAIAAGGQPPGEDAAAEERALERALAVHAAATEPGRLADRVEALDRLAAVAARAPCSRGRSGSRRGSCAPSPAGGSRSAASPSRRRSAGTCTCADDRHASCAAVRYAAAGRR